MPDTRIDIVIARVKVRIGPGAESAAGAEVERHVIVVDRVQRVEQVVANAGVDREILRDLPLIFGVYAKYSFLRWRTRGSRAVYDAVFTLSSRKLAVEL